MKNIFNTKNTWHLFLKNRFSKIFFRGKSKILKIFCSYRRVRRQFPSVPKNFQFFGALMKNCRRMLNLRSTGFQSPIGTPREKNVGSPIVNWGPRGFFDSSGP